MGRWYEEKGPDSDVVVSTRVRLARNFKNYSFPWRMTEEQRQKVIELCRGALDKGNSSMAKNLKYIDMKDVTPSEKQAMVEKRIISPDFAGGRSSRAVIVSKNEEISIMINEEDHIRIQCIFPGLQAEEAWQLSDKIDTLIEENIEYAFDENCGYLTCCPTNVGTGMRTSFMLHLPGLIETGYINGVLETCSKVGVAVRGVYGEHSQASGNMLQISNQVTLGLSEKEIIINLLAIINQIIGRERELRQDILSRDRNSFEDRIFRSYGILSNARLLSSAECMKLLSDVRLGINMGIIKGIDNETINGLIVMTQPANIQLAADHVLDERQRDMMRANLVRNKISV